MRLFLNSGMSSKIIQVKEEENNVSLNANILTSIVLSYLRKIIHGVGPKTISDLLYLKNMYKVCYFTLLNDIVSYRILA